MPRWNPPPNWPSPPERWFPPPGWQPDPAWGPPPPGWQFWVDEPAQGWAPPRQGRVQTAIWQRTWFIVAALIVFFPAGLALMWRKSAWTNRVKWVVTAVVAGLVVMAAITPDDPQDVKQTAAGGAAAAPAAPSPPASPAPEPTTTESPAPSPTPTVPVPAGVPAGGHRVEVVRIIDGDTLAVRAIELGAPLASTSTVTVRLLEIDTPETKHPDRPVQCYGSEAAAALAQLVPVGSAAYVVADRELRDRYGRYLLYVWNAGGTFVNLSMVDGGFAKAVLYAPNDAHITEMRQAEQRARSARRGLWAACATPTATPAATPKPNPKPKPKPKPAPALACSASMSNPRPAQYSTTTAIVRTAAGASVTATAYYKTTDTSHTATAAGNGVASIPFKISRATKGYRVDVEVTVSLGDRSASCSTSFTPR